MLHISETYVNETKGYIFGETPLYETRYDNDERGKLFRSLQREYGRCVSKQYVDTPDGTITTGWVFQSKQEYEDSRPNWSKEDRTYIREVWVTVVEVEDPNEDCDEN